jgi:hypothetical protein
MARTKQEISDTAFGKSSYAAYLLEQGKTRKEIGAMFNASTAYGRELTQHYSMRMRFLGSSLRPLRSVLEMLAKNKE